MTAHDPRVTLTEVLAAHVRLPMMHSQGCSCGWHASLSHPDLHRDHVAERIEEHIAARLAPIRALADEAAALYNARLDEVSAMPPGSVARRLHSMLGDLAHVALDAPVSASQDHDGAEGQGEGERAGDAACDACPEDHCNATGKPWCIDEETR